MNKQTYKVRTYKIFSYCEDFEKEEKELLADYGSSDTFVEWTANSSDQLNIQGYEDDIIANKLYQLGAEENEIVLIHLDW